MICLADSDLNVPSSGNIYAANAGKKSGAYLNMRQIYKGEIEEKLVKQSSLTTQRNEL